MGENINEKMTPYYYYWNSYYDYDHPDMCPYLQLGGYAYCGCDSGPEPISKDPEIVKEDSCALCPEGMVLSDALLETREYEGKTCGDFERAFQGLPKDSLGCKDVQKESVRNQCCMEAPCQDNPFTTFQGKDGLNVTCYKLSRLSNSEQYDECYNNNALNGCPETCNHKCMCGDYKDLVFENPDSGDDTNAQISCYWLTKSLSFKKRTKFCNRYSSVAQQCPDTCRGWCTWYGNWNMTGPPVIDPTPSPEERWDDWYNDDWYKSNYTEAPSWWYSSSPYRYTSRPNTQNPWSWHTSSPWDMIER